MLGISNTDVNFKLFGKKLAHVKYFSYVCTVKIKKRITSLFKDIWKDWFLDMIDEDLTPIGKIIIGAYFFMIMLFISVVMFLFLPLYLICFKEDTL